MKKVIFLTALLAVFAAPAFAQVELAWNACKTAGGTADVAFPCGGADGSPKAILIGSFLAPAAQPNLVAMDGQLDLRTAASPLPDFFKISTPVEPANCNPGVVFGDERPAAGCAGRNSLCGTFPAGGQCDVAFGALTSTSDPTIQPDRTKLVFSIFRTSTIGVVAGSGYFTFKIDFYADLASESAGPCVGCAGQAAIVFNRLGLLAPVVPGNFDVEVPTPDCATWNGGTSICAITPTTNKTWGALKSLYR